MADKRYKIVTYLEGRNDGRGGVNHDMVAEISFDGGETWSEIGHKTVVIPASVIEDVLAAGNQSAIVTAYKAAIRAHHKDIPVPLPGLELPPYPVLDDWDADGMNLFKVNYIAWQTAINDMASEIEAWQAEFDAANDAADTQAAAVNALVDNNFGGFPVHFTL